MGKTGHRDELQASNTCLNNQRKQQEQTPSEEREKNAIVTIIYYLRCLVFNKNYCTCKIKQENVTHTQGKKAVYKKWSLRESKCRN